MNNYIFEECKEEYLSQILEIYNYYVLNSTATFHIKPLTISEMGELVFFDNPIFKTFVIWDDKKTEICGYVILNRYSKREAYNTTAEVSVYLRHDFTSRGLGKVAADFIENYAKENGFHALLGIICTENEKSINLVEKRNYQKCGYLKETGKKFGKYLDVAIYQKLLTNKNVSD
jgi:phosphinothricin acetyltransferase